MKSKQILAILALTVTASVASHADIRIISPEENPVLVNTYAVINEGNDTIEVRGFAVAEGDTLSVRGYAVVEPKNAPAATVAAKKEDLIPVDTVTTNTYMPSIRKQTPIVVPKPQSRKRIQAPDPFVTNGILGHFTWGVDIGSGVDCSAHDMTMFHLGASLGYKNQWFRFLGAGIDIVSMMNNQSRCYPIYGLVRTSFSPYYQVCFAEFKAGVSINSISGYNRQSDFYGSVGIGFTLAHSRVFSSHIIVRYTAIPLGTLKYTSPEGELLSNKGYLLSYACVGIGCAF